MLESYYKIVYYHFEEKMEIGIYGLGRFGSFFATKMIEQGHQVYGFSRSGKTDLPGIIYSDEKTVLSQKYIFFCVAISAFEEVIKKCAKKISNDSVVCDTCSVKLFPCEIMEKYLPENIQIMATHPMFGPDSAKNGLKNLPLVICPVRVDRAKVDYWEKEFSSWGLDVFKMSPDRHDREAAYSQGITHFLGRTLKELDLPYTDLATVGYKSLMEIVEQTCNDSLTLFKDLQHYNPYAVNMRRDLKRALQETMNALEW